MKKSLCALAVLMMSGTVAFADDAAKPAADTPTPGTEANEPTSDRTPNAESPTPLPQTTKKDGETSDRTPENHGEDKKAN